MLLLRGVPVTCRSEWPIDLSLGPEEGGVSIAVDDSEFNHRKYYANLLEFPLLTVQSGGAEEGDAEV